MIPYIGADVLSRLAPEARPPAPREPGDVHHPVDREVFLAGAAVARGRDLGAGHAVPALPRLGVHVSCGHAGVGGRRRPLLDLARVPAASLGLPLRAGSGFRAAAGCVGPDPRHPPRLTVGPRLAGYSFDLHGPALSCSLAL